ncbi:hypothetical protein AA313_de0205597 [Arthrobotrys entomopaga]|nr:hypothetical protein AA313_de0205597 [Arthrobotrys entomopaga]
MSFKFKFISLYVWFFAVRLAHALIVPSPTSTIAYLNPIHFPIFPYPTTGFLQIVGGTLDGKYLDCDTVRGGWCHTTTQPSKQVTWEPITHYLRNTQDGLVFYADMSQGGPTIGGSTIYFDTPQDIIQYYPENQYLKLAQNTDGTLTLDPQIKWFTVLAYSPDGLLVSTLAAALQALQSPLMPPIVPALRIVKPPS